MPWLTGIVKACYNTKSPGLIPGNDNNQAIVDRISIGRNACGSLIAWFFILE